MGVFVCLCVPVSQHLRISVAYAVCVVVCQWMSASVGWQVAHEDPPAQGRPGWLDPAPLSNGSLTLWVRVAEAFLSLKIGSPGSALRVLGPLYFIPSKLVFEGERDSWGHM